MDRFEKKQLLEEFLIKWKTGKSIATIDAMLREKYNPLDVEACRRIFEKWVDSKKEWKEIDKIK